MNIIHCLCLEEKYIGIEHQKTSKMTTDKHVDVTNNHFAFHLHVTQTVVIGKYI
jgi:hypothetical protein